jgi:CRP-like cAMP-binding protein
MAREYGQTDNPSGRDARMAGYAPVSRAKEPKLSRGERRELADALSEYEMFEKCDMADVEALVKRGQPFSFPAGRAIVTENTPADACYIVTGGSATVYRERDPIAELGAGAVIGEMAVLTGKLRRATVTTNTRTHGLVVDNDALLDLLTSRHSLLSALRSVFASRAAAAGKEYVPEPLPVRAARWRLRTS